jgi:hypothetical protein
MRELENGYSVSETDDDAMSLRSGSQLGAHSLQSPDLYDLNRHMGRAGNHAGF